jgi:uncharacterized membrane protein YbhN (UPF0104 family)
MLLVAFILSCGVGIADVSSFYVIFLHVHVSYFEKLVE